MAQQRNFHTWDLYFPHQSGVSNRGRLHFLYFGISNPPLALPEFAASQLPNTQLLDGRNSRHLPINQENSCHGESEKRHRRPYRLRIGLVVFWSSMRSGYFTLCCMYIIAGLNSTYLRNSDKARNLTVQQESPLARAEFHYQNELENLYRVEVWTLTRFKPCWSFDYRPTASFPQISVRGPLYVKFSSTRHKVRSLYIHTLIPFPIGMKRW